MKRLVWVLFAFFSLISCGKNSKLSVSDPDIYGCGYYTHYFYISGNPFPQNKICAVYWKNDEFHPLTDNQESTSVANDILISENHIYVVGEYEGRPCYWIDGQKYQLIPNSNWNGRARALMLKNGNLYIVGEANASPNMPYAAYLWIIKSNDQVEQIELSPATSSANDLYVDENLMYVSGKSAALPCYWTYDGVATTAHTLGTLNVNLGEIYSIISNNNIPYASGYFNPNGDGNFYSGYWMDSQFVSSNILSSDASFSDLAFSPIGELFFVGRKKINNVSKAALWKSFDTEPTILSDQESGLKSIVFDGDDYYVSGNINYRAAYWKNGGEPHFFNSTTNSSVHKISIMYK